VGRPAPQLRAARDARPGARRRRRRTGVLEALREVFADTKEQRCWWQKIGNVLAALPKSAYKEARAALAVARITNDLDVLLAFYDLPGERWIHLRTANPIRSIPPTSSRWSEPARSSRTAGSSNDPTNQQAMTLTP
jgi:transposase-like protein